MTRWLTLVLLLCSFSPLFAQVRMKGKNRPQNQPAVAGEKEDKEDESRVVLAFDPGSHTRPIDALGFNKDQTQLITVAGDYTIQIWSASSGERLDIIRLPAFGRDNGFDSNRWNQAAISADGAFVAIGGGPKMLFGDNGVPTRLLIVDVLKRRVRKIVLPVELSTPVTCLDFSGTGDRLAIGVGGVDKAVYILDDVRHLMQNSAELKLPSEPKLVFQGKKQVPLNLALSTSGNKLVFTEHRAFVRTFDVTGPDSDKWKQLGEFVQLDPNDALEWAPDESQFVWSWRHMNEYCMEQRLTDGELLKKWNFIDLPGFSGSARVSTFQFLDANRLFISAMATKRDQGRGGVGSVLDLKAGKSTQYFFEESVATYLPFGAATSSGKLAATTTSKGLEAVIYDLTNGTLVAHCGSRTPVPTIVGWARDSKAPALAWSDDQKLKPWNSQATDLQYAFDLTKIEPVAKVDPAAFELHRLEVGEWNLAWNEMPNQINFVDVHLKQGARETTSVNFATGMTLIPTSNGPPLFAHSIHDKLTGMGSFADVRDDTGKVIAELLPVGTHIRDMVSSPDGRYLLLSTGTHRLSIYRTDGSRFPFLNLVQANGEWLCWTPAGYYAASPGGEKMLGWSESRGSNEFPLFHTAEKFSKEFHRPDIIKLALEKGSLNEAVAALKVEVRGVEEILPPHGELKLLSQKGGRIHVQAIATSSVKNQPVVALRLLLDGRPLPAGTGFKQGLLTERMEVSWELDIPAGKHEVKLLTRGADSSAISAPLIVEAPKSASQQPVLHRLCVGINEYSLPALNLNSANKDATDVFAALEKHCVGTDNHFGTSGGALLTDAQATRPAVLKAIADIRKAAKPGDLVVLFFAGHGIKQQAEYYLMTHEADPSVSLQGESLSGSDLRQALVDMECPVLLVLDSCHAANGVKAFRPATDDLTRNLTDDSAGVTVLAAAMSHEVASATNENGYFTAAFLKALQLGKGVPFDPHEHVLYTHHIYSVVFSEVRHATNGKQNPFLNMPWTVPPLAIRDVPPE